MRFAFLLYVSRSGSTLLASNLNAAVPGAFVMPECRVVEYMLAEGDAAVRRLGPDQILGLWNLDHQFRGLGLDEAGLRQVAEAGAGQGIRALTEGLVRFAAGGTAPEVAIVKCGTLAHLAGSLAPVFPEARILHVYRDARACISSMITTERVYFKGEKMARGDVYYAARHWSRYLDRMEEIARTLPVLEVRYEDYLVRRDEILAGVATFLGLGAPQAVPAGAALRVSAREQSLHTNVSQAPQLENVNKWRAALTPEQATAIELFAGRVLRRRGYTLDKQHFSAGERAYYTTKYLALFVVHDLVHYLKRARYYARERRVLAAHAALAMRRTQG